MRTGKVPLLAILLTLTTFVAGAGYLISQQVLRMSANDPQIQLAEDAANHVAHGEIPSAVIPDRQIDMSASLASFIIFYDDSGRPVAGSALLGRSIPSMPRGVFDYVRSHGEERLTWQPRPGVRIASVVTRTTGGFVVAGRNLRELEVRESMVFKLAAAIWLVVNCILLALWLLMPRFGGSHTPQLQLI